MKTLLAYIKNNDLILGDWHIFEMSNGEISARHSNSKMTKCYSFSIAGLTRLLNEIDNFEVKSNAEQATVSSIVRAFCP